jgi:hypothetical protein
MSLSYCAVIRAYSSPRAAWMKPASQGNSVSVAAAATTRPGEYEACQELRAREHPTTKDSIILGFDIQRGISCSLPLAKSLSLALLRDCIKAHRATTLTPEFAPTFRLGSKRLVDERQVLRSTLFHNNGF